MPFGYQGKILHVLLNDLTLVVEEPSEAFYRTYMGGSALGAYYLLKHTSPQVDPLGPDNTLILSLGVTTGAPISGQSRLTGSLSQAQHQHQRQGGGGDRHHDPGDHHGMGDRIGRAAGRPAGQPGEEQKHPAPHDIDGEDLAQQMPVEDQGVESEDE